MATTAGLILCGGKSSRMGYDKASLRIGPRSLLELALERLGEVAQPIVLSLAAGAATPSLPSGVLAVSDGRPEQGPLWGLLEGFRALEGKAEQVLVMPVDMPFFTPPWMHRLVDGLAGQKACLFQWEGFTNALTAAYRLELLPKLESLVAEGRMRPLFISEGEPARVIAVEDHWREGDGPPPLMDMDTPEAYRQALLLEGIGNREGVPVTVEILLPPGPGSLGLSAMPPLPLIAATGEEALAWVWRLYPELQARYGEAGEGVALIAIGQDGGARPLSGRLRLSEGEHLRLDLSASQS
ncbi:MAG: molybdenum cofactor guanylyltransferase [SAR324 cluster bacterium]|nr:molybdenum cofactor guanylyltransferase [SAR324 cluster bacterium]